MSKYENNRFTERVKDQSKCDAIANSWHFPSLLLFVATFFIPLAKAVQFPANHPTVDLSGSVWDSAFEPTSKTTCQEWFQDAILLFPPGFFPSSLAEEIHQSFAGISASPFHRFPEWLGNSDCSGTIGTDIAADFVENCSSDKDSDFVSFSHRFTERVKDQSKCDAIANSWHFPSLLLFVAMFLIPLAKAVQFPANHPTVDLSGSVWDSAFEPTSKTTCQEWFQDAILLFPPGSFPSSLVEEIHHSFAGISASPVHRFPSTLTHPLSTDSQD